MGDASSSRSRQTIHYHGDTNNNDITTMNVMYLDSPSTTSATTYKLTWFVEGSSEGRLNYSYNDADAVYVGRTVSTITVMEVLA